MNVGIVNDLRPTWDETWMNMAHVVAKRSRCVRDQVGAVVVSIANRIVDTGYNGPPRGLRVDGPCVSWCQRSLAVVGHSLDPDYKDCVSLHAEANALMFGDRTAREHGTIYVTSGICSACAKLIGNSGLMRVVVDITHTPPHRSSDRWYDFIRSCGLRVDVMKHES